MKKTLKNRVNSYSRVAKSMAKPTLAAVAAMAAMDAQAAEIHGAVNQTVTWASGGDATFFLDINGGGNDIKFFGLESGGQPVFRADNAGGAFNGLLGTAGGAIGYPYALGTNYSVSAGRTWAVKANNTLANERYGSGAWQNGALGTSGSAFLGFRLLISGNTHYGWIRITKSNSRSWMIHDWAYDDAPNTTIITPGALPVELTAFRAQIVANAAQLLWATASE
jgi:hypothetical protein